MKRQTLPKLGPEPWFVPAEIVENIHFMMAGVVRFWMREWPRLGLGGQMQHYFTYFKGDFSQMWYPRSEFDAEAEFLSRKMLQRPDWALRMFKLVEDRCDRFMAEAKKFNRLSFRRMTSTDLTKAFNRVYHWHVLSHGVGAAVSWHADADTARVSRDITALVEAQIRRHHVSEPAAVVFSALSTPLRRSFIGSEEKELLKLAVRLFKQKKFKAALRSNRPGLSRRLELADSKLFNLINVHYERWRWLRYAYKGPAYSISYFLGRLQILAAAKTTPARLLAELDHKEKSLRMKQRQLTQRLRFNSTQRKLIEVARGMVFNKEYRKNALYFGLYCYEPFFKEAARRLKLELKHIQAMAVWELIDGLRASRADRAELEARNREMVCYATPSSYQVFTGQKAKEIMRRLPREKSLLVGAVTELQGTCASPGFARGVVKIVDKPSDIKKMKPGDILVSETTYPSLVPAMKLAAAIVTNAGGLTTHAAIVSRELGVPCVVGTKVANKVLKDGDRVEVDATKGVVKRLKA